MLHTVILHYVKVIHFQRKGPPPAPFLLNITEMNLIGNHNVQTHKLPVHVESVHKVHFYYEHTYTHESNSFLLYEGTPLDDNYLERIM